MKGPASRSIDAKECEMPDSELTAKQEHAARVRDVLNRVTQMEREQKQAALAPAATRTVFVAPTPARSAGRVLAGGSRDNILTQSYGL